MVVLDLVVQVAVLHGQVLEGEQQHTPDTVTVPRESRVIGHRFAHGLSLVHHVADAEGDTGRGSEGMGTRVGAGEDTRQGTRSVLTCSRHSKVMEMVEEVRMIQYRPGQVPHRLVVLADAHPISNRSALLSHCAAR